MASSSMSFEPLPPPTTAMRPLRFHPPTSAPHLHLQPDHLTVSHVGPGNHSADHSLLHTARPVTFSPQRALDGLDAAVDVFYFEVKVLNAGKRGEIYVGMATGESPAIDPQLVAAIQQRKVRDSAHDNSEQHNGRAGDDGSREEEGDDEQDEEGEDGEQESIGAPYASDRYHWQQSNVRESAPALSQSAAASTSHSASYSSSAQRQLGLEHPHSFSIQLSHGRLYSIQHSKGLSCLPTLAAGDTLGIGYVHNALTSTAAASAAGGASGLVSAVTAAGTSAQPLLASSLTVSSYVFFTKNGRLIADKELNMDHINALLAQSNQPLSCSPSPVAALLFPAVSFHSPSEAIQATFAPSAFLFDVAQYEAELRDRRLQLLAAVDDGKSGLLSLVREYLLCWGYDGTASVLEDSEVVEVDAKLRWSAGGGAAEGGKSSTADRLVATSEAALRTSLRLRGGIRQLIQSADVKGAVRQIRNHCPSVLRQRTVRFHLHSLQFINILTTQQPAAAQSDAPSLLSSSSPILAALQYARRHLHRYLHSASLSPLLGRMMALLAMSPTQWSGSRLTGVEWRERVADIVNTAILEQLTHKHSADDGGTSYNGDGRKAAELDSMEDGEERSAENGKSERKDGSSTRSGTNNGMDVEQDQLFGVEDTDSEREEAAEDEDEAEDELHGSQLELLIAQLFAVNSLWQHQRPSLSIQPVFPHAALEQLMPR